MDLSKNLNSYLCQLRSHELHIELSFNYADLQKLIRPNPCPILKWIYCFFQINKIKIWIWNIHWKGIKIYLKYFWALNSLNWGGGCEMILIQHLVKNSAWWRNRQKEKYLGEKQHLDASATKRVCIEEGYYLKSYQNWCNNYLQFNLSEYKQHITSIFIKHALTIKCSIKASTSIHFLQCSHRTKEIIGISMKFIISFFLTSTFSAVVLLKI